MKSIKIILEHATMLSYTSSYVNSGGNIEYIYFNLPKI